MAGIDPGKYGSIVSLISHERVYGIRGLLTMPSSYRVNDLQEMEDMRKGRDGRKLDPDPKKHNYFDAYFSLCTRPDGEDGRVEAGIFKYSGEEGLWHAIRTGVGTKLPEPPAPFLGKFIPEKSLPKPVLVEVLFLPDDEKNIVLKLNGEIIHGVMTLNKQFPRRDFEKGGLFPKVSIGMCNYAGDISFSEITFTNIEITHTRGKLHDNVLHDIRKWQKPKPMFPKTKFTNGDNIPYQIHQPKFTAWLPPGPHARPQPKRLAHPHIPPPHAVTPEPVDVPFVSTRPMSPSELRTFRMAR